MIVASKFFDLFGLATSAGVINYAGLFLATDILTEKYGKEAGYQTVRIGFFTGIIFIITTQLSLLFSPLAFSAEISQAMDIIFSSSVRVMIAGLSVYFIIQHFDVWLYHFLGKKTGGKHLWLRNNGSTITSQVLDSLLFFTIAFYGTMPFDQFVEVLLVGCGLKITIALFDTPFIYLAKKIKPKDL